jgi:hypothetical protein
MRPIRHLTPRYVCNRLAQAGTQRRHPEWPWLTRQMVQILTTWLMPSDRGIEWGSGRSTTWFAERVSHLTSVEHNPEWFDRIQDRLYVLGYTNVDYRLVVDVRAYVNAGEGAFDFALIDGMERDACAMRAIALLRPRGILIVDNVNWFLPCPGVTHAPGSVLRPSTGTWAQVSDVIRSWRAIWTSNGVTDTAIWVKP